MDEQVELCIQPCCTGSAVRYLIVLESILQSNPIVSGRCVPPWALRRGLTLQAKDKRLRDAKRMTDEEK